MHFINGRWQAGQGDHFTRESPATGVLLWEGEAASRAEVEGAIASGIAALPTWSSLTLDARFAYLKRFQEILRQESDNVAIAIAKETGKPLWEARTEVDSILRKVDLAYEAHQERCKERREGQLRTRFRPQGLVCVLAPFNFPGHLPHGHILPALLAGNTVIWKSSELTPLVSETLCKIWEQVALPGGVLQLLQGGKETGALLAHSPHLDGLFFTGSHKTGMALLETFAHHPEKILALEMGGNNPLVVADVPDAEAAAYLTILSAYLTAGQRCSCARRLIVVENDETTEYLRLLKHMTEQIVVGPYTQKPEPFMGPLIAPSAAEHLLTAQATLAAEGGIALVEMQRLHPLLPLLTPGLIDVTDVSVRKDEEFFGPLLQLIRVPTFEAALAEAKNTRYGLTAGLISRKAALFEQFFQNLRAGVVNWNTPTTGASSKAPFGGVGWSGNHRPSGYFACDYSSYPIASMENPEAKLPSEIYPGIPFLAST